MEKKMTAVDWLHCQLDELEMTRHKRSLVAHLDLRDWIFDQAKQLEKQQIKNAYVKGQSDCEIFTMESEAEQYYAKTYESTEPI